MTQSNSITHYGTGCDGPHERMRIWNRPRRPLVLRLSANVRQKMLMHTTRLGMLPNVKGDRSAEVKL